MSVLARTAGAQFQVFDITVTEDLDTIFERMMRVRVDTLVVDHHPFTTHPTNVEHITSFVAKHRIPAIADGQHYAEAGLLLTYSVDFVEAFRNAADYIARILNGASPADLPIHLPLKHELIINLRTAKTLGITIPQALLVQASKLIR